jgi:RNA polymerase sigma-70 factor (ECF subfamily)
MTPLSEPRQLVAHLFRHEAGRLAAVLTRLLGFDRLELAEDIVQDTMVQALRNWPFGGIPDNPRAWLYRVAKHKALDVVRRENLFGHICRELSHDYQQSVEQMVDEYFLEDEINDSQLRMLFACCHPAIPAESQVAMCLKILCGLSVKEIARAFVTAPDTVEKRLHRAKEKIRTAQIRLEVPTSPQLAARLPLVLKSIYLLFNEGYNSTHPVRLIRQDLCAEAMRLGLLLSEHPRTASPAGSALLALMCFQAARFEARTDASGAIVLLADQDRTQWDRELIQKGRMYLNQSAEGAHATQYHLEAGIAMLHCTASSYESTNWLTVLHYYDLLLACNSSPVVALHRAVALSNVEGPAAALGEVVTLSGLHHNQYYHAILGDLYQRNGQPEPAREHYQRARQLTPSTAEQELLSHKLNRCIQQID